MAKHLKSLAAAAFLGSILYTLLIYLGDEDENDLRFPVVDRTNKGGFMGNLSDYIIKDDR